MDSTTKEYEENRSSVTFGNLFNLDGAKIV
jgi:hypothetical protein